MHPTSGFIGQMTKSPPYMLQLYKSALALLHSNPIFIPSLPLSSVCVKKPGGRWPHHTAVPSLASGRQPACLKQGAQSGTLWLLKGDILWKQHFSWDLGCCAPTRIQTLKKIGIFWVPRLQLPNKRVNFGAPSYVGREYIWILPPTSPPPSNQSIAKIL